MIDAGDEVLLKPEKPFSEKALADVAASLGYRGEKKTLEDMAAAIRRTAKGFATMTIPRANSNLVPGAENNGFFQSLPRLARLSA